MLKKIILAIMLVACVLFTSCSTTRTTDRAVLEHQRQLAEYQAAVNYYFGRIDSCAERIGSIGKRAENLTGEIERVIELFDEYQRAVEQLLQDYNSLRAAIENKNEGDCSACFDSCDNDIDEAGRLLAVLERY